MRLYAILSRKYGQTPAGTAFEVELPHEATIEDLLAHLGVPREEGKVVFVNGRAQPFDRVLEPGDEVGIFPPVGGG